ncbi:MAG: 2'-5' RNA ligase family protein [Nanoarchaeota archaeon]
MPYAIEVYFDDKSSNKIKEIRTKFKNNNINIDEGTDPHISLLIFQKKPLEKKNFLNKLEAFSNNMTSLQMNLANIGIFNKEKSVVFLSPKVDIKLLEIQKKLYDCFKDSQDLVWDYYKPENWVPHCTLGMDLTDDMLVKASSLFKEIDLPIRIVFKEIGILKFRPNEEIVRYKIG